MTLKEIFATEPTKLRVICFAKDGNTVVTHHEGCYHIAGNYYAYGKPNQYGGVDADYVVYYPSTKYALKCGYIPERLIDDDRYDWTNDIYTFARYKDTEAEFVKQMDATMECGSWITMAEIRMLDLIFKANQIEGHDSVAPYLEHRERYKKKREEEERRQAEKEQAEELERKMYAEKEHQKMLDETKCILKEGGIKRKPEAKYVLELAELYNVKFPPRVKSWYRKNNPPIRIENGEFTGYYYTHECKSHSESIGKYMNMLLNAIKEERVG